ncbi:hypothetical protein K1719_045036 [Acacia pycnantha]|nr:hypothetical protein K1719_045036 [Acacia pycnantha]
MEGPGSEENNKSEVHLTSAAAFVEGGIQDACDDACSICLEAFHESDPSTVTSCKHEFHLQCILEWCQRSPQCPMCWQSISFKDPSSQELLEALQHLPVGANDADLEERIIQHLAAAAMGRARHIARREGQRNRSSAQGRPHFLVFSTHPNSPPMAPASPTHGANGEPASAITVATLSQTPATGEESSQSTSVPIVQADHISASGSGSTILAADSHGSSYNNRRSPSQSSPSSQDRAGPSEFQSFSESLKSRFNAVSTRYKESISRSTRGWKERWFSRNSSMSDVGSEGRQEANAGMATVSRMMERLDTRDNNRNDSNPSQSHLERGGGSVANDSNPSQSHLEGGSVAGSNDQHISDAEGEGASRDYDTKTSFAAGSSSN